MSLPGRSGWRRWLLVGAVVGVVGVTAGASLHDTAVYYRTPSELAAHGAASRSGEVRLGGLVQRGSVHRAGTAVDFVLTDGHASVPVQARNAPPSSFRAGQGAVVEGTVGADGVFVASRVLVKHSEEYRAPRQKDAAAP